jgi:spermidine synthase
MPRYVLPATVFLTGASVLIVEVLAVRVLSPYYGNTIFTVSSVISVILLALSAGYYAGGRMADRHPSLPRFFALILASGLLLLLLQFIGTLALPRLGEALSLETGPLVSSAALFLLPALLLGMLSPYAVKLQSVAFPDQGVGSAAGVIFFWSTVGSITGSLAAGFVLVPNFGVSEILIANALGLVVLGFVPLVWLRVRARRLAPPMVALALILGASWFVPPPVETAPDETVIYVTDGVYQKISVYEGQYYGRPTRFLLLDRSESGAMFLDNDDPTELVYDYTKYYSLYKLFTPRVERALVLGGGAYSIPKALVAELPDAIVDVAEIEPSFFELSKQYFRVPESPRLRNHVQDGRRFLQDADAQYDLIFGDVYYSYFSVPPHFTTQEFFALAKARLQPGGVFIANMIGDLSRRQPSLIMAELKTFQSVFPNSYYFAVDSPAIGDLIQNITLVGYNGNARFDLSPSTMAKHPDELIRLLPYKRLDVERRYELSPYPLLTDNFSPVEYLTARALRRSLNRTGAVSGEEILAVIDQQARLASRAKVQDFLAAEMAVLAQESDTRGTTVRGRFSASDERRVTLAARYDSPSAVAVLVEYARSLLGSTKVRQFGLDIVFFEGTADRLGELDGESKPIATRLFEEICGDSTARCTAATLENAAAGVLDYVDSIQ